MNKEQHITLSKKIEKGCKRIFKVGTLECVCGQPNRLCLSCEKVQEDIKQALKEFKEDFSFLARENDWEVAHNDNCKDGFRVISAKEFLEELLKKHFGTLVEEEK
jgi:hypothetical protein